MPEEGILEVVRKNTAIFRELRETILSTPSEFRLGDKAFYLLS